MGVGTCPKERGGCNGQIIIAIVPITVYCFLVHRKSATGQKRKRIFRARDSILTYVVCIVCVCVCISSPLSCCFSVSCPEMTQMLSHSTMPLLSCVSQPLFTRSLKTAWRLARTILASSTLVHLVIIMCVLFSIVPMLILDTLCLGLVQCNFSS